MTTGSENLDRLCINTVRMLAVDAIEKARSGHPGMPMGAAPMAYALWTRHLRHNPGDPLWPNRDRFVLSAGHGSMLLYALLHLTGYDLPLEELQRFRQWGSRTPGHPEHGLTPGVETTTGPLGQGLANAVGMAMAERHLAARFNRPGFPVVDHRTYVLAGDGDLMEGVCHEAASLAGHLQLGKLICLYDDNRISIEGSTDLTFTEDRGARFRSYGWQVLQVEDGNDVEAISAALREAEADHARPSLIMVRTQIGFGSPGKAGKASAHGEPLGADEVRATKLNLGWPLEPAFFIPEQALQHFRTALERGRQWQAAWEALWLDYQRTYPELAAEWNQWWQGQLPQGWDADIPAFAPDAGGLATRVASGTVLNALAGRIPYLVGGAADLEPSTKTGIRGGGDFSAHDPGGRNIHFGVREHAMGAILNGMALHGGLLPFGATFLVFSNYMLPPVRLAALMGLHVIYVFTHDSIGLGEDGPTHQPVEQLASLRAIPGLTVLRPADANETAEAWRVAVQSWGPVALVLTRQNVPVLDRTHYAPASGVARGAYVLKDPAGATPAAILLATGSEVHVALEAAQGLEADGIPTRVVSMPSWELFERQSEEYRRAVLPPGITRRVAIEAGSPLGWHRYVGPHGTVVGMEDFGASAPAAGAAGRGGSRG
ncbi:MAG: transketolase, partial [Syntrophomonadaceae bacterium]|nr:transketolase [Syntrophomonadaceae bacterium]